MSYQLEGNAPPSKVMYIDSKDADIFLTYKNSLPLTTHFQFTFNDSVNVPSNVDTLVSLHSASVPYSFYNIRDAVNDVIDFRFGTYVGADEATREANFLANSVVSSVEVPEGNYNITTFLAKLKYLLENDIKTNSVFAPVGNPDITFDFRYVRYNQKCILSFSLSQMTTGDYKFQFLIDTGTNSGRSVGGLIGLRKVDNQSFFIHGTDGVDRVVGCPAEYRSGIIDSTIPQNEDMFMTPNCVDLQQSIRGVYVRTNINTMNTLDSQSKNFSKILGRVPINVNAGGVLFLDPANSTYKSLINVGSIKVLQIRLTDERNRILNLNGLNFQIALQFDFIYREKPIPELTSLERRLISHHSERPKLIRALEEERIKKEKEEEKKRKKKKSKK